MKLQELFLDDNELTGTIPTELGRLVNANYICLASNNLGEFKQAEQKHVLHKPVFDHLTIPFQ